MRITIRKLLTVVYVIAHVLSVLGNFDGVISINEGKVVFKGNLTYKNKVVETKPIDHVLDCEVKTFKALVEEDGIFNKYKIDVTYNIIYQSKKQI